MGGAGGTIPALSGLLMGLGSSLHCAGVCGGISASLLLSPAGPTRSRGSTFLAVHGGRALTYVSAGIAVGAAASVLGIILPFAGRTEIVRALAALNLVWAGLSLAGWGPSLSLLDGVLRPVQTSLFAAVPAPLRLTPGIAAGVAWGLMPCGMVYAALMTAMLAGSPVQGGAVMAGFALGTMPSLTASAFGIAGLWAQGQRSPARAHLRRTLGFALSGLGFASLLAPVPGLAGLCAGLF